MLSTGGDGRGRNGHGGSRADQRTSLNRLTATGEIGTPRRLEKRASRVYLD